MNIGIEHLGFQSIEDIPSLQSFVYDAGTQLIAKALEEGELLYEETGHLDALDKADPLEPKVLMSYALGSHTKQLVMLYRDIYFECQKAIFLQKEEKATEEQLGTLLLQSKETIQTAIETFDNGLSTAGLKQFDAHFILKQDHPWIIYKDQLSMIADHFEQLKSNETVLETVSAAVIQVREALVKGIQQINIRYEDLLAQSNRILASKAEEDVAHVLNLLTETNQHLDQREVVESTHRIIERAIHNAPVNMTPKVGVQGGYLIEEELTPQYLMEQWYDIEILPLLEDSFQQMDTLTYNLRLALINITNRIELLQNKTSTFNFEEHLQPIHRFQESAGDIKIALDDIAGQIIEKRDSELSLGPLLDVNETFLSLGFQGSINRFRKEQNLLLDRLRSLWSNLKAKYFSLKSTVQEESTLGDVEKVVRFIRSSSVDRGNLHYNNFFNAKVTMVEAFWIGRELEQKRLTQVLDSWNAGFQGAVLLTGDRYAGKSSLGDWLSQKHFRGKTYHLKPRTTIMISNKKVEFQDDLIGAIKSFIERVQYAKPLIWIDDIELWFNEKYPSDAVTRQLLELINEYSKKVFFIISMGHWTHQRLGQQVELDYTFQAIIPLVPFSKDLIKDAILLRHGASHKTLIGEDGQELSTLEFDRGVAQITSLSEGNIGHALQLWINRIRFKDDNHVQVKDAMVFKFPDIIKSDNGILLTTLLFYRKMKEVDLASMLGPAYEERYKLQIAKLVGYGVIKKAYNGTLSLNDRVVPAITELLRKNKFI